jgi:hypothetical protein
MAGSLKPFRYRDDAGSDFTVILDESNSTATVGGVSLFLARTAAHPLLSGRVKKRYVTATLVSNPNIKRRFWVGNPLAIPQILAGAAFLAGVYPVSGDTAVTAVAWSLGAYRGEKGAIPPALNATLGDTGLTDGSVQRDA